MLETRALAVFDREGPKPQEGCTTEPHSAPCSWRFDEAGGLLPRELAGPGQFALVGNPGLRDRIRGGQGSK